MSLHVDELAPPETGHSTIATGPDTRLVVARWDAPSGRSLVALTPEYRDRRGEWRLAHSAVSFPPSDAGEVAAAILEIAARIDGAPADPMPSAEDRELSRRP